MGRLNEGKNTTGDEHMTRIKISRISTNATENSTKRSIAVTRNIHKKSKPTSSVVLQFKNFTSKIEFSVLFNVHSDSNYGINFSLKLHRFLRSILKIQINDDK